MLFRQNQGIRVVAVLAMVIIFTGVGYSFISYQHLVDQMLKNEIKFSRLETNLQKLVTDNNEKLDHLSRKQTQLSADKQPQSTARSGEPKNQMQIVNYIKAQNKLIAKLLKQHEGLQEQFTLLKRQGLDDHNLASPSGSGMANGSAAETVVDQKPITIEDLEQEMVFADQQEQKIVQQTEATFQSQSQQGNWAAQTNIDIQNTLEKIRTDLNYSDFNINNVDCRETMCKIELSHGDAQRLEEFDLIFLHQLTGDQPMSTTFDTEQLADGSVSRTYYLSIN